MPSEVLTIVSRQLKREAYYRLRPLKAATPGAPTAVIYFHDGYCGPQEYATGANLSCDGTELLSDGLRAAAASMGTRCGLVFVSVPGRPGEFTARSLGSYVRFLACELRAHVEDGLGGPVRRALTGFSDGGFFSMASSAAFPEVIALSAYAPSKTLYINNARNGLATIGPVGAGGLRLFCGNRDGFHFSVEQLHRRLLGQRVPHTYTVWPGLDHDFDPCLEPVAADMARILGVLVADSPA